MSDHQTSQPQHPKSLRADAKPFQPSSSSDFQATTPPLQTNIRPLELCDEAVDHGEAALISQSSISDQKRQQNSKSSSQKGKKVVLPTEIFSFHYDRPSDTEPLSTSSNFYNNNGKKSSGKGRISKAQSIRPMTKSEYVQAK